ncbi:hypothetical protein A3Q56_01936 [Intoshia linei]|uniref:Alpha N-terminal protein methyltransferase 1 n=1 Tax=Intoshia linei TaxID=1819745 RepID=A0A177B9F0_9BILA|nr:hypothetical protein A3Q56_01936 [Intoshia linei]
MSIKNTEFYKNSANYWMNNTADVSTMLGGIDYISENDILQSKEILDQFIRNKKIKCNRALDVGSGIGRITKNLLINYFKKVDLVDISEKFLNQAKSELSSNVKFGNTFCSSLVNFHPQIDYYNVIWCQWILSYLTNQDLIQFLQRCKEAIQPGGYIFVKENVLNGDNEMDTISYCNEVELTDNYDKTDGCLTRSITLFKKFFEKANLHLVKYEKQLNFPKNLYPVYTFILRPL